MRILLGTCVLLSCGIVACSTKPDGNSQAQTSSATQAVAAETSQPPRTPSVEVTFSDDSGQNIRSAVNETLPRYGFEEDFTRLHVDEGGRSLAVIHPVDPQARANKRYAREALNEGKFDITLTKFMSNKVRRFAKGVEFTTMRGELVRATHYSQMIVLENRKRKERLLFLSLTNEYEGVGPDAVYFANADDAEPILIGYTCPSGQNDKYPYNSACLESEDLDPREAVYNFYNDL
ncbi:hypothetical protein [Deinococcus depolymerans]|uniref:Uncharacterized protein n=1 Tax=Deinococcus depolymerans TaxID=392408 RepID=A0ABP3MNH5_9DEIO